MVFPTQRSGFVLVRRNVPAVACRFHRKCVGSCGKVRNSSTHTVRWNEPPSTGTCSARRCFSGGWTAARGHDITRDSLEWGSQPKINITGYSESGFNVKNMMKKLDERHESDNDGTVHMNGSVIVFPNAAFLWSIEEPKDVTIESLSSILLYRPKLDYLFIGSDGGYGSIPQLNAIQNHMRLHGIVVEQTLLYNAIGTFNILNAEDRQVAAALLISKEDPTET
jgi:uncharacterized protein